MRLWSLHPRYLDAKGLVALWREALLAQAVLLGKTTGYRHHPQLSRFREMRSPSTSIAEYLRTVHAESVERGYRFDATKIGKGRSRRTLIVTRGQIQYEWSHLLAKLESRDTERWAALRNLRRPRTHPLFRVVPGAIEAWEVL